MKTMAVFVFGLMLGLLSGRFLPCRHETKLAEAQQDNQALRATVVRLNVDKNETIHHARKLAIMSEITLAGIDRLSPGCYRELSCKIDAIGACVAGKLGNEDDDGDDEIEDDQDDGMQEIPLAPSGAMPMPSRPQGDVVAPRPRCTDELCIIPLGI